MEREHEPRQKNERGDINSSIELGDTDLKTRTLTVLWRKGHRTVADLHGVTATDLMPLPGFGKECLDDLRRGMEPYGVVIYDDDNPLTIKQVSDWMGNAVIPRVHIFATDLNVSHDHALEALQIYAALCR